MCDQGVEETYIARVRIGDVDMPATYVPSLCAALCVTADDHGRIVARRKFELLCVRGHTSAATGPAEAVMGYWAEKQRCRVGAMMVTMAMILGGTAVSSRGIRGVERIYIGGQKGRLNWTGVRRRNWSDDDDYDDGYGDDDDNDDDDDESDCSGQNGDVIKQSFYVPHSRQTRGTELESGLSRSTSINFNSTYNNATNSSISNSISSSTSIRRYSKNQTMNYQTFDQSSSQPHIEHQDDDQDSYNMAQYGLHWVHCTDGDIPRNAVVAFEDDASLATVSSHTNAGCTYVARLCVSGHHQDRNGLGDSVEEDSAHGVDIDFDREIPRCYVAAGVRHKEIAVATTVKTRRSRRRCFGGHRNGSGNDNNGNKRRGARLQLSTRVSSEYDVLTMETMSSRNNQERKTIDTMLRWVSVHPQESESHDAYHSIHRSPLVPQSVSSWSQSSHRPQTRWRIPGNAVAVPVNDGRTMEVGRVTRGASSSYADTGSVTVAEPGYILRGRRVSPGQRYDDGTLRDRRRGRWRLGTFEAQARTGYGNREICEGRTVTRSQADYDGDWNYWDWDWDWECEVLCIFPSNTNTITNTVGQQASVTTTIMSARPTASPMCLRIDVDAGRCRREGEEEEGEWWTQTMLLAARGETSGMIVRGDDGLTEIERDEARWQWRRMGGDGGSEWEWERAERKRTRAKMIVIAAEIGMCAVVGMYLVWIFGLWPSSA